MSFTQNVKEELSKHYPSARHCNIAEIAAIINFLGKINIKEGVITVSTENPLIATKYASMVKKTYSASCVCKETPVSGKKSAINYSVSVSGEDAKNILLSTKIGNVTESDMVTRNACCKRAYLRGAFLATGSVTDPNKSYHFEMVCKDNVKALKLQEILKSFDISAKIVERKSHFVVYLKDASEIVDVLNVMEAFVSLMEFENVRIVKEVRNNVNRNVNCETANLNKTVSAAVRQRQDIELIRKKRGLESLPDTLYEIALLRLDNPDATLLELGAMLENPVGKSGVNHRLRKLSEIAKNLKEDDNGNQKHES